MAFSLQSADLDRNGLIDKYELGKLLVKLAPLEHPIDDLDAIFGKDGSGYNAAT